MSLSLSRRRKGASHATGWMPQLLAGLLLLRPPALGAEPQPWPNEPMSDWALFEACQKRPTDFAAWYPPNHLKMPLPKRDPEPADAPDRVAVQRCRAGAVLHSYDEPVLAQGSTDETYRVIWHQTFVTPVVIRLFRMPGGGLRAVAKRDVSTGDTLTGHFRALVSEVSEADFQSVQAAAQRAGCWTEGNTCHAELSDPNFVPLAPREVRVFADGETWTAEGARKDEHWAVQVSHPKGGPFMQLCRQIVRAAHAESWLTTSSGRLRVPKPGETLDGGP